MKVKNCKIKTVGFLSCIVMGIILFSCQGHSIRYDNGAVPPADGVGTYEVVDGFQMELFASEPLISDPVDMAVDENGTMYVVEMPGYPLDKSHTGKIKILKDRDGDGIMDESILFADELMFPNGVMPWKNGVMVTDAPHILYLEDTDGDGVSDVRDTLMTGFSLSNPHVNVNNPVYGLDNWVYLSHFGRIGTRKYEDIFGDHGEEIRFWDQKDGPRLPQNANSKNVRFKMDGEHLEMLSVKGQYGHAFDEWGHHFLTHNQNHIYHEVLAPGYIHRNPEVIIPKAADDISDHGMSAEVFQITTNPDRQLFTPVGLTTSSSGIIYYTGGLFPEPYDQSVTFVCESVSNLVHSDRITENGASFISSRIEEGVEFLASRDSWARPVNMYIGPDGALYVMDYYRRIIEHPEWMSDEAIEAGDLYDGYQMGRIYRISPEGTPAAQWTKGLNFGKMSSEELVPMLSHRNKWWRSHAQRILVDRNDEVAVPVLKKEVRNGKNEFGRLHAMWTLEGMGALEEDDVLVVFEDGSAGVRENGVLLSEQYLKESRTIRHALYTMVDDPSSKVRFQLLNTLGGVVSDLARTIREELLFDGIADDWFQRSALTATDLDAEGMLEETLRRNRTEKNTKYHSFITKLSEVLSSGKDKEEIMSLLRMALDSKSDNQEELQTAILKGVAAGIRRNKAIGRVLGDEMPLMINTYFNHPSSDVRGYTYDLLGEVTASIGSEAVEKSIPSAVSKSQDKTRSAIYRAQMVDFIALGNPSPYETELKALIHPGEDPTVQKAALDVYGMIPGAGVSRYVLDHWDEMTPNVRDKALTTFMSEDRRVELLLDALESGDLSKSELGWSRTVRLNQYPNEVLRNRART